jgi:UDP-N-acetylglucosamine 4,6-dehydratase/5-epimerase
VNDLNNWTGKKILITGGSGFLGRALIARLLAEWKPASILCLARDEGKLLSLKQEFGVDIMPGDVSEWSDVYKAMMDRDQVFHLAGFKHLPLAETESAQSIKTNVVGSMNVLDCSLANEQDFVLGISTDKAYNPINCYGMTKRLMEYLFAQYEREHGAYTKYRTVRYGNVIGSTGSVIEIWKRAAMRGEPLKVTDFNMTRFFFTANDAVNTIFGCLDNAVDATPYVPKMKAVRMGDLAEVCRTILCNRHGKDLKLEITGLRPGEKISEGMADDMQSDATEKYTHDEIYCLVNGLL